MHLDVRVELEDSAAATLADQQRAFAESASKVRIVVNHPEYQADVTLTGEQREELVGDFAA